MPLSGLIGQNIKIISIAQYGGRHQTIERTFERVFNLAGWSYRLIGL